MVSRYYLTDGGHVLIAGSTGAKDEYGGKTTTANWWVDNSVSKGWHTAGVFINPKGHNSIVGQTVSSLSGLAQSWRSGYRQFDVRTDTPGPYIEVFREMGVSCIWAFDEAQMYRDSEQLNWVLSQGGNLDSGSQRALVLTQRPWNLSEELRANLPVKIWVGPVTPEGVTYFENEKMGSEIQKVKQDMKPYHWAVTDAGEYQHVNPPVPESYT